MRLEDTVFTDLNSLPYFVMKEGQEVGVRFEVVAQSDGEEIRGPRWTGAVYRKLWAGILSSAPIPRLLKLVRTNADLKEIEGVLMMGKVPEGGGALRESLLESAPPNHWSKDRPRLLSQVGRVLVARLIAESYNQGGSGIVIVKPHPAAVNFYRRLGFSQVRESKSYAVTFAQASEIFQSATK